MQKNKTILVVEDDIEISGVIRILLEEEGYTVSVLNDSVGVYDAISYNKPDLILLDIWMAGLDGLTITKKLKHDDKTKHLPIILLSAANNGAKNAEESGADGFVAKPFNIDDLVSVVKNHV